MTAFSCWANMLWHSDRLGGVAFAQKGFYVLPRPLKILGKVFDFG